MTVSSCDSITLRINDDGTTEVVPDVECYSSDELKLLKQHRCEHLRKSVKSLLAVAKLHKGTLEYLVFVGKAASVVSEIKRIKACTSMVRSDKSDDILKSLVPRYVKGE